jgi:CBS domain containing-hemolysin-like protein
VLAFTSAADAAFTAISRHRLNMLLADGDNPRTKAVSRLLEEPYRFKTTILILNAGATIAATAFTLRFALDYPVEWKIVALGVLFLLMMVVSEAVPKALAIRNPDATAMALARPMSAVSILLSPLMLLINVVIGPLFGLISGQRSHPAPLVTEEELRLLVNVGEEEGLIEHEEREMIESVFTFGDTLVREIMVPRVDIIALEVNSSLDAALDIVIDEGHSRIPVYQESLDTIVGILYAKDLLTTLRRGAQPSSLRTMLRPAYFVPETMRTNALLHSLQQRKVHMALVVDEYGGVAGLATIEDLIEQIVGEIQDEYDSEEPPIQQVDEDTYVVDATVLIAHVNAEVDLALQASDVDRIGGLVYELLGSVPHVGDVVTVDDATITVLSVQGVRPQKLRIVRQRPIALEISAQTANGEAMHHGST